VISTLFPAPASLLKRKKRAGWRRDSPELFLMKLAIIIIICGTEFVLSVIKVENSDNYMKIARLICLNN